jgi:hypothetical protein
LVWRTESARTSLRIRPARTESAGVARTTESTPTPARATKSARSTAASAAPATRAAAEAAAIVRAAEHIVGAPRSAAATTRSTAATETSGVVRGRDRTERRIYRLSRRHHIVKNRCDDFPFLVGRADFALHRFDSELVHDPTAARPESAATPASPTLRQCTQRRHHCGRCDSSQDGVSNIQAIILS